MKFIKTDAKEFNRQLLFSKRLEFLTLYTIKELELCKLYITTGGGVGFGLTPDGDIFNLFNNTDVKFCGLEALDFAITKGGRKVFCFDGFLTRYYEERGFRVTVRVKWLEDFAPDNWNYKKYGRPDIVWLTL